MKKFKRKTKYYVTLYERYPIYEPAEGGYYYDGRYPIESVICYNYKRAKKILDKMADKYDVYTIRRYVGEGYDIYIEQKYGQYTSGRQIYC